MAEARSFDELALTLVERLVNDVHTDLYDMDADASGRLFHTGGFEVTAEEMAMLRVLARDKTIECAACGHVHEHICLAGNGRSTPPLFCACEGTGPKERK